MPNAPIVNVAGRLSANGQKNLRLPPGCVDGLNLTRLSNSQVQIGVGCCRSAADDSDIVNAAPITVDITVAGLNGLDTGAEANDEWYYVWIVLNPTTGVVGGLLSLSATAPTMPAGFTVKRRIGFVGNGAPPGHFLLFAQTGTGREKSYWWDIVNTGITRVLSGGAATVYTDVVLGSATGPSVGPVPPPCTQAMVNVATNATSNTSIRPDGFTANPAGWATQASDSNSIPIYCPGQIIEYQNGSAGGSTAIVVLVTIDDL